MKLRMSGVLIWALALCAICRPQTNAYAQMAPIEQHLYRVEKEEAVAEALIRQRVEDLANSIRAKDINGVMSLYAPDIVSFDVGAPLAIHRGET